MSDFYPKERIIGQMSLRTVLRREKMAENQFKQGEIAARIVSINDVKDPWRKSCKAEDLVLQKRYDSYVRGGGEPLNFLGKHIGKNIFTEAVIVYRIVNNQQKAILAYTGMPLLVGDLIVAEKLTAHTELLLGGVIPILVGKSAYVDNSGNVVILTEKSFKEKFYTTGAIAKFQKKDTPLTIQKRGGVLGGIKG